MAKKPKKTGVPGDTLALYEKLIATDSRIERKGAALPYTSRNGHMFSFLSAAGSLGIRLPNPARDEFLRRYKTTLVEAHGTILKEYVRVPDSLLKRTAELKKYLVLSFEYVDTLKPKATNRPKKPRRKA